MPHQHDRHHDHSHQGESHRHDLDRVGHNHHHPPANYNRAFVVGILLNGSFVLTEFAFGIMANSVALIADAGHNLSDVLGLLLAWVASILARRQPSSIIAALLNAVFLLVATGGIMWEAIQRTLAPGEVNGQIVIGVAAIGIFINIGTAVMFLSGRKGDMNIRAAFQHMLADAMVSVGVVLAGVAILATHWLWLDPAFSLIISALIIVSTWKLLKDAFNLAIDGVPQHIDERAVRTYLF
jgi:cobalt-zinc-cadmium efflux system protein